MWKRLLPVLLVGCVTEGNEISGSWTEADGGLLSGAKEGECIGDVRITVHALGEATTHTASCSDGGFDVVVPYDATHVKLEVRDDWSNTEVFELDDVDGNIDVGRIYFEHFSD